MTRITVGVLGSFVVAFTLARPAAAAETDAPEGQAPAEAAAEATAEPEKVAPPAEALKAEPKRAPNSVYAEGLGAAILYSINYERLVLEDLGVRAGFSYLSVTAASGTSEASASLTTIPVTVSYLGVGSKRNILELGGGMSFMFASASASSVGRSSSGSGVGVLPNLMLGYRLHPVDGAGFQFRVGAMAFVGKGLGFSDPDPEAVGVLPWFYLSLGASF